MKDVLWPYPEILTSVEVATPDCGFAFKIPSEPASGFGDRHTFQSSPVVSPAVRGAEHKRGYSADSQGLSADSRASGSWPRTPELSAEAFEDNSPTSLKFQKTMASGARPNKRMKSQQGKEKNRDAQRRFRQKQKDTIESQQREIEGLKVLLAMVDQDKKACQAKASLAYERYNQLEKALQQILPRKGNFQDAVCPAELAGTPLRPQMSELVAQIQRMQHSSNQGGEGHDRLSSHALQNLVESAIQCYVTETKAKNRDLATFAEHIGRAPVKSGILANKAIGQFVDDLQLQPHQVADIGGLWTWFAQCLGGLLKETDCEMTALKARGGSVFTEDAIKKQHKISEDILLEQLTRRFFEALFLPQQAQFITSPTRGALDIVVVILYIAAWNELHSEDLVQSSILQQFDLLWRPAT